MTNDWVFLERPSGYTISMTGGSSVRLTPAGRPAHSRCINNPLLIYCIYGILANENRFVRQQHRTQHTYVHKTIHPKAI